jgi:uncharacterized membrane protein
VIAQCLQRRKEKAVYSKVKIAGHPVHPMLVAFLVACYTGTLVGFAAYAANGHLFWLNLAIALSVAGTGTAVLAALATPPEPHRRTERATRERKTPGTTAMNTPRSPS